MAGDYDERRTTAMVEATSLSPWPAFASGRSVGLAVDGQASTYEEWATDTITGADAWDAEGNAAPAVLASPEVVDLVERVWERFDELYRERVQPVLDAVVAQVLREASAGRAGPPAAAWEAADRGAAGAGPVRGADHPRP